MFPFIKPREDQTESKGEPLATQVDVGRFQDSDCQFTLISDCHSRRQVTSYLKEFIGDQQARPSIIGIVGQVREEMMSQQSSSPSRVPTFCKAEPAYHC